jgi:hypothetical protein
MSMADIQQRRDRLWCPAKGISSSELDIVSAPGLRRKRIQKAAKLAVIERGRVVFKEHRALEKAVAKAKVKYPYSHYQQRPENASADPDRPEPIFAEPPIVSPSRRRVTIRAIAQAASQHFRISLLALVGNRRDREAVRARQVAIYLAREHTMHTYKKIGDLFGRRDHSTVIHACRRVEWYLGRDIEPWCRDVATVWVLAQQPPDEVP